MVMSGGREARSKTSVVTPLGLRERTRAAVRGELSRAAMELFVRDGFDQTTVADIAAAAGVSTRSFFRYFPSKETVVLAHLVDIGHQALEQMRAAPAAADPWDVLRAAFEPSLNAIREDPATSLAIYQLLMQSAALRATHSEKGRQWCELLEPELARRLQPVPQSSHDPRARALVSAALACYDAACYAWANTLATVPIDALLDEAIATVRGHPIGGDTAGGNV
ncbi:TetR/AcrR family transcriptional regulator [Rhodococcoides yunnanense]|uniref:TetR family transcriptional regulator n=1 Tax=Rhodococcoides yunnanense TaxID=278209 RepID=A0ABU4BIL2_9NOCA|nr:TetR family transcriptional regulator [Rhodococcus yunnanensis]MDV6264018.1 TetR family transcriptional regulator [Rhodococcus yunnanensis]